MSIARGNANKAGRYSKKSAETEIAAVSVGDRVLYCIRQDDGENVYRAADVITTDQGVVTLCVTLLASEQTAAGARVGRLRTQHSMHGYVYDANEGDGIGQFIRR